MPGRARCWRSKKASPTISRTMFAARSRLISRCAISRSASRRGSIPTRRKPPRPHSTRIRGSSARCARSRRRRQSQNSTTQSPTSVGRNVPQSPTPSQGDGKQAAEDSQKKEELTNYELSSKVTSTVSNGFVIEPAFGGGSGQSRRPGRDARGQGDAGTDRQADGRDRATGRLGRRPAQGARRRYKSRRRWISSTAARSWSRLPPVSIVETLMRQFGTIVSALAMLGVAALVVWAGLRPATRALIDIARSLPRGRRWR